MMIIMVLTYNPDDLDDRDDIINRNHVDGDGELVMAFGPMCKLFQFGGGVFVGDNLLISYK